MGPLYFILARGSRAECGHSLGGALRWEWVACLSRGDGRRSCVHGIMWEQDGKNKVGEYRGYSIHPMFHSSQSWLFSHPETFRLNQIKSKEDYNSQYAPQLLCMYLGVVVPLRSAALSLLPQSLTDGLGRAEQRTWSQISKGTV